MSDEIRCYFCNRTIPELLELLGIPTNKAWPSISEMEENSYTSERIIDKQGKDVYAFILWSDLSDYKNQFNSRIKKWIQTCVDSYGHDDSGISVYTHKNFGHSDGYWIRDYLKEGGMFLDDTQVERLIVDFNYYNCPVCRNKFNSLL